MTHSGDGRACRSLIGVGDAATAHAASTIGPAIAMSICFIGPFLIFHLACCFNWIKSFPARETRTRGTSRLARFGTVFPAIGVTPWEPRLGGGRLPAHASAWISP